jgi:hypothetical protein
MVEEIESSYCDLKGQTAKSTSPQAGKLMRILIVYDGRIMQEGMKRALVNAGDMK